MSMTKLERAELRHLTDDVHMLTLVVQMAKRGFAQIVQMDYRGGPEPESHKLACRMLGQMTELLDYERGS